MKIINLVEDTKGGDCLNEHGLSFYIETKKHKLLVDSGATDMFLHNADMLGIDLTQVDTFILSHGHYDHAGGLTAFAKINPNAKIYLKDSVGGEYYHLSPQSEKYIGIDNCRNFMLIEYICQYSKTRIPRGVDSMCQWTISGFVNARYAENVVVST